MNNDEEVKDSAVAEEGQTEKDVSAETDTPSVDGSDNHEGDGTGEHEGAGDAPIIGTNPQDDYGEVVPPRPEDTMGSESNPQGFTPHLPVTEETPAFRTDHTEAKE